MVAKLTERILILLRAYAVRSLYQKQINKTLGTLKNKGRTQTSTNYFGEMIVPDLVKDEHMLPHGELHHRHLPLCTVVLDI